MAFPYRYTLLEDGSTKSTLTLEPQKKREWFQTLHAFLPSLPVLLMTWAVFVAWYLYGSSHWYRDPESFFYDAKQAYTRKYSLERENETFYFLERTMGILQTPWKQSQNPEVCAVITSHGSLRGKERHPLELTVASLAAGLTPAERDDLDLRVYISNTNATQHPLYNSTFLQSFLNSETSAESLASTIMLETLRHLEHEKDIKRKTALDTSLALEHCYENSTAPIIAFFEDDIVAADSWFSRIRLAVRDADTFAAKHGKPWLDIRLFNAANELRWSGGKTVTQWALMLTSVIFAVTVISALIFISNRTLRKSTSNKHGLSDRTAMTIAIITIPLLTLCFFGTSKSNIFPRPDGLSVQHWGCCTQGSVFHREQVPGLVSQIRQRLNATPWDISMWQYAEESDILRIALDPPMVQHLGFSSLVNSERMSRNFPWNVDFEDLSAERLHNDHQAMVKELYGSND